MVFESVIERRLLYDYVFQINANPSTSLNISKGYLSLLTEKLFIFDLIVDLKVTEPFDVIVLGADGFFFY